MASSRRQVVSTPTRGRQTSLRYTPGRFNASSDATHPRRPAAIHRGFIKNAKMARRLLALAVSATALQAPHAKAPTAPLQATATAPAKTGPTWDDHVAIPEAPDTMVKGVEGNDSMRRKFEQMLREAQNKICSAVEELDGEGTFRQDVWERENGGGGISRVMAGRQGVGKSRLLAVSSLWVHAPGSVGLSYGAASTGPRAWSPSVLTGPPDNSSLRHFSAMARPSWLGRAARNWHRHAIEQAFDGVWIKF